MLPNLRNRNNEDSKDKNCHRPPKNPKLIGAGKYADNDADGHDGGPKALPHGKSFQILEGVG
ncbi:hypothetical protein GCM10009593_30530 [Microlunatus antarcticus]